MDQVKLQMTRKPYPSPKMILNPEKEDIDSWEYEDFRLEGYQSHPHIKGDIAV